MHLANAGKYLSAMLAVSFRLWYLNSPTRAGLVVSIIAAVVATAYQAYWDLVMDWGLLRRGARHPWLRDQLVLKHQSIYYVAMVRCPCETAFAATHLKRNNNDESEEMTGYRLDPIEPRVRWARWVVDGTVDEVGDRLLRAGQHAE